MPLAASLLLPVLSSPVVRFLQVLWIKSFKHLNLSDVTLSLYLHYTRAREKGLREHQMTDCPPAVLTLCVAELAVKHEHS